MCREQEGDVGTGRISAKKPPKVGMEELGGVGASLAGEPEVMD